MVMDNAVNRRDSGAVIATFAVQDVDLMRRTFVLVYKCLKLLHLL